MKRGDMEGEREREREGRRKEKEINEVREGREG